MFIETSRLDSASQRIAEEIVGNIHDLSEDFIMKLKGWDKYLNYYVPEEE